MRQIKFRAWDSGKIFYQKEAGIYGFEKLLSNIKGDAQLMQSTSLTDRNGIEIYEGDIVKSHHNNKSSVIRFGEFTTQPDEGDEDVHHIGFYFGDIIPFGKDVNLSTDKYEVIGNI